MFHTILAVVAIVLAFVIAVLAVVLPPEKINFLLMISRFFEVMIPILAVGALIKYLTCCRDYRVDRIENRTYRTD